MWRATTPYFTPGEDGAVKVTTTTGTNYSDPGRIGDPSINYYYLIVATASDCPVGVSQRMGEFDFALAPGALLGVAAVRALDEAGLAAAALPEATLADTQIASFTYDAAGRRVSATVDGVTTVYPFDHYEVMGTTVRKYYSLGGTRVALRVDGALSYLLTDHLGSTSVSVDASGVKTGATGFYPFGATRYTTGVIPTDRRFTGQPRYATLGLDYFGARWYDSSLGRFIQADTIVQSSTRAVEPVLPLVVSYAEPGLLAQWNEFQRSGRQAVAPHDPQLLNRYTYVRNNPLAYRDDTGHVIWWVVGGIGGAVVGFGAYALTHQDNFDWGQAALWTGGGAVVGATFGAGAQWVAGALTAEAAAAAGTAATTAGVAASSPTGQRTILWLENQLPRVQHIMAQKHAWDKLVNLGGNLQQDYQAVQPYLSQVVQTGERTIMEGGGVQYRAFINGQEVIVRGIELANGAFQIADAFVKTVTR